MKDDTTRSKVSWIRLEVTGVNIKSDLSGVARSFCILAELRVAEETPTYGSHMPTLLPLTTHAYGIFTLRELPLEATQRGEGGKASKEGLPSGHMNRDLQELPLVLVQLGYQLPANKWQVAA